MKVSRKSRAYLAVAERLGDAYYRRKVLNSPSCRNLSGKISTKVVGSLQNSFVACNIGHGANAMALSMSSENDS